MRRSRARAAERGVSTVYALMAFVTLLMALAVVASGVRLARAQHQAAAAADLAALAGAQAVGASSDPCEAAARVASANGAQLRSCRISGDVVDVLVELSSPRLWGRTWLLRGRARAGPDP